MRRRSVALVAMVMLLWVARLGGAQSLARGTVFLDANRNGIRDRTEPGLAGVCVSNGREVVRTDRDGGWSLPAGEDTAVFVIKPAGYGVAVNAQQVPQCYRLQAGRQPGPIDFPLYRQREPERFTVIFFGDTQCRGLGEVNYLSHDVVEECLGTDAAFGVSLGDIAADGPELFPQIAQSIAQIGIPWYNVFGNHDHDREGPTNARRDEGYQRLFGPSTYAFEYRRVAFIALNDIYFEPDGRSSTRFRDDQLAFVKAYLATVPSDRLVVLMMHAPIVVAGNREEMFRLLAGRPHTFSISSHLHETLHVFINRDLGWPGKEPHHHFINPAVSGSWWVGTPDETGIPHATMNDGTPNGYSLITFEGNRYRIRFKAARRPADYQMNLYLPDEVEQAQVGQTEILANVFGGSERSQVEMQVDGTGPWLPLEQTLTSDPACLRMYELGPYLDQTVLGKPLEEVFGWKMDYPSKCRHMWKGVLPAGLAPGTHTICVRTVDMFGQTWNGHRILRVR